MADFSEILKRERINRGLSLRSAGVKIGISHSYLASLENGEDPRTGGVLVPSADVLKKIVVAYELSEEDASVILGFGNGGISDDAFLVYAAKKINGLKETNPSKYRELVQIVTGENGKGLL